MEWLAEPIETERLILRRPEPDDLSALVDLATDDEGRRFLGGAVDRGEAVVRAEGRIAHPWGGAMVVDRVNQVLVGKGGIEFKRDRWELSYEFGRRFWGRGYAVESIGTLINYFLTSSDVDELFAETQEANSRSIRLLERLGGEPAGQYVRRSYLQCLFVFRSPH